MKKSISDLILTILIGSAILIAGLSNDADGKSFAADYFEKGYCEFSQSQAEFFSEDNHNSEFWSKFRESVMPDEKNPPSNHAGNDNTEAQQKFPGDKKN